MSQNKEQLMSARKETLEELKPLADKVKKKEALTDDEKKDYEQLKAELSDIDSRLALIEENEKLRERAEAAMKEVEDAKSLAAEAASRSTLKPSEMEFEYDVKEQDENGVHVLLHEGAYFDGDGKRTGSTFVQIYTRAEAINLAKDLKRFPRSIEKILHDPYGDLTRAVEAFNANK